MSTRSPPTAGKEFRRIPSCGLPVFMKSGADFTMFYVPRLLCILPNGVAEEIPRYLTSAARGEKNTGSAAGASARNAAVRLLEAAQLAGQETAAAFRKPFHPECLTVFLNNRCNLHCRYCGSAPNDIPEPSVSRDAIRAAAHLVAAHCANVAMPLTLALHGGGEPTIDSTLADDIIDIAKDEAANSDVAFRTYIATNGVMSDELAQWLISRFDLVGVSCDGPPDVQNLQRPQRDGSPTAGRVHRTLERLRQQQRPFHIRVTLTRSTVEREEEIVSFLADQYAPTEIRIEPVYRVASDTGGFAPSDVPAFVEGFMAARRAAGSKGIPVTTSISRPGSLYGRYCHVFRHVLNVVPGDVATACFLVSRTSAIAKLGMRTGAFVPEGARFVLDEQNILRLMTRCSVIPTCCEECFCRLQCTFGCPDRCVMGSLGAGADSHDLTDSFRCQLNRGLLAALVWDTADRAWKATPRGQRRDFRDEWTQLQVLIDRRIERDK